MMTSWCYTELEGRGGFVVMTIEQLWHFQPRRIPVPFLVLHRVRAGEGCRDATSGSPNPQTIVKV